MIGFFSISSPIPRRDILYPRKKSPWKKRIYLRNELERGESIISIITKEPRQVARKTQQLSDDDDDDVDTEINLEINALFFSSFFFFFSLRMNDDFSALTRFLFFPFRALVRDVSEYSVERSSRARCVEAKEL